MGWRTLEEEEVCWSPRPTLEEDAVRGPGAGWWLGQAWGLFREMCCRQDPGCRFHDRGEGGVHGSNAMNTISGSSEYSSWSGEKWGGMCG